MASGSEWQWLGLYVAGLGVQGRVPFHFEPFERGFTENLLGVRDARHDGGASRLTDRHPGTRRLRLQADIRQSKMRA